MLIRTSAGSSAERLKDYRVPCDSAGDGATALAIIKHDMFFNRAAAQPRTNFNLYLVQINLLVHS